MMLNGLAVNALVDSTCPLFNMLVTMHWAMSVSSFWEVGGLSKARPGAPIMTVGFI